MQENLIIQGTLEKISTDFELELNQAMGVLDPVVILDEIKERLSLKIKDYMDNDVEKLLHILYRIDIPEFQVNRIFSDVEVEDIPSVLSDLIIDRQLSKARTREFYKKRILE